MEFLWNLWNEILCVKCNTNEYIIIYILCVNYSTNEYIIVCYFMRQL